MTRSRGRKRPGESRRSFAVTTLPSKVAIVREGDNPWYEITLTEGRNRQIRRMFEEIEHHVEKIKRVRYGPLTLNVEPGKWRLLSPPEVSKLRAALKKPMEIRPPRPAELDARDLRKLAERVIGKSKQVRPKREWSDRPPRRDSGTRPPQREAGTRPPRKNFGDRKEFGRKRDFGENRPPREFGDRPPRHTGDERPARDFRERGPRREGGFQKSERRFEGGPKRAGGFRREGRPKREGDFRPEGGRTREGGFNRGPRRESGSPRQGSFGKRSGGFGKGPRKGGSPRRGPGKAGD
jgi:23S rRNA pseudouridine2605 synthase